MELFPEGLASIMALDTIGPIKDEVLPMMLNSEKNKNSLPRGVTSEIMIWLYEYQGHTKRP